MRRLVVGCVVRDLAGRRMVVERIATIDGIRMVYWRALVELKAAA